jgi:hypothetical protein
VEEGDNSLFIFVNRCGKGKAQPKRNDDEKINSRS